ncbi:MAG TPA: gluconolaconase [Opitutae bacterium]|nr:gluconolaconase [Opitutae bacterium]HAF58953.1 gluconolaconase [Opitutae bacterium]|tara:strand:+ start:3012 stop:3884 length:873 start_codon:yes stop_codon:yes gene_type:complete
MNDLKISTLGSRSSKWGEGPIYWKDHLLYVDIEGHSLIRLNPETQEEEVWGMRERIGTVVPTLGEDFICAGDSGIYRFDPSRNQKTNLADPEANKRPDNRFNDGKCDPRGRLWAGTISTIKKVGDANLYLLDQSGVLTLKVSGVTNSNGICWNASKTQMYYIDTPTQKIISFEYDDENGNLGDSHVAVNFAQLKEEGSPDGMTIDQDGMLWVAMCHGGSVLRLDPHSGELLQKVELPCVETTACAFGGKNLDRLFVTTGHHKTLVEKDAGKVFAIDGLGLCGIPASPYLG